MHRSNELLLKSQYEKHRTHFDKLTRAVYRVQTIPVDTMPSAKGTPATNEGGRKDNSSINLEATLSQLTNC